MKTAIHRKLFEQGLDPRCTYVSDKKGNLIQKSDSVTTIVPFLEEPKVVVSNETHWEIDQQVQVSVDTVVSLEHPNFEISSSTKGNDDVALVRETVIEPPPERDEVKNEVVESSENITDSSEPPVELDDLRPSETSMPSDPKSPLVDHKDSGEFKKEAPTVKDVKGSPGRRKK